MKLGGCNALITGASAGIGREFARQLAGRAQSLILIARRDERLNELRDELNQQYPNLAVSVRKTDLADLAHLNELLAWLDHERIDVDLLINDAGLGDSGAFARSHPVRNEQMILVNIVAGVCVCALCPGPVHTEFQDVAKRPGARPNTGPEFVFVPVEEVVRDALAALKADHPLVIPGVPIKLGMFLVRITPLPILRLLARFSLRRG
jgi:short-subunit dehydrogenase